MTYSLSMFANRLVGERARTSPSPSSCDLNNNFWQRSSGLREGLGRQRPSRAPVGMVRLRIGQRASGLTRDLGTAAAFLFVWKRVLGSVLSLEKSCINRRKKKISLGKLLRTMFQGPWGGNRKEWDFCAVPSSERLWTSFCNYPSVSVYKKGKWSNIYK